MSDSEQKVRCLLRDARQARGFSARRLSVLAGLSDSVVGKIENGMVEPGLSSFARIVTVLELNDREIAALVRLAALAPRATAAPARPVAAARH